MTIQKEVLHLNPKAKIMKRNNLGYLLNLEKCESILTQWNLTHLDKIPWYFDEDANEIYFQGVLPEELQTLINEAV